MTLGDEREETIPSMKVVNFVPGMECPVCPEKKFFTNVHAFDRHWSQYHIKKTTTFYCPVDHCHASHTRFRDLTRHYSAIHAGRKGSPGNPMVVCRRAKTKVAENRCFLDPGCLVFRLKSSRQRSKASRPALAENNHQAEPEMNISIGGIQAQPEGKLDAGSQAQPEMQKMPAETWELAYDRQALEVQALRYEMEQLTRRLANAVPAWPTMADIPLARPGLDEFIRGGREAMAVLHQAEDRRFMEQLTLRRQADAYIQSIQGKE